jgi:hypothetical protein
MRFLRENIERLIALGIVLVTVVLGSIVGYVLYTMP